MPSASATPTRDTEIRRPTSPPLRCRMSETPVMSMMASTAATADSEGQREGSDEHRALNEILGVIGDVQHREAVQDDPDEDRASHGADYVGAALVKHGEPDERRRNAVEQQRRAGEHVAASHPRSDENPA